MNISNKIILITNIPTPYRIPLFNELNRQLEGKGLILKVIFGALGYKRRNWEINMSECKFDYELLCSRRINYSDSERIMFTYSGLLRVISKEKPCVIVTNAFSIATMKIWWQSLLKNTPFIIWSGAIGDGYRSDSFLRRFQRKLIIKRTRGFIAYGSRAKEYLMSLGAKEDKIEIAINTVDTIFFKEEVATYRKYLRNGRDKKHLLYVGDLSIRKNVLKVLKIINNLVRLRSDIILDIVGDGEEQSELERYVHDNNLTGFVTFHGFKQKHEIRKFLAQSSCYLFQTDFDIWGLVLVEAMAAGLPCIASIHAGATYDLVKEGVTGFAIDFSEVEKVAGKINWILENPELAMEIGQNAKEFISENVNIKRSAASIVKAIQRLLI